MWKSPKNSDSAHSHRTTTTEYTDISNGYITLTFPPGANRFCKRRVEVFGWCKVEMSELPPKMRFGRQRLDLVTMNCSLIRAAVLSRARSNHEGARRGTKFSIVLPGDAAMPAESREELACGL